MFTIETDQGPFFLKITPAKAHFRSGTAVGRCWVALGDLPDNVNRSIVESGLVALAARYHGRPRRTLLPPRLRRRHRPCPAPASGACSGSPASRVPRRRLAIEVGHEPWAMVLGDEGADGCGQAVALTELHAAPHVVLDHSGTLQRFQLVAGVPPVRLVLDVHVRLRQLADIVVVGANPHKQRVGADASGGALGHRRDEQRVMERARRLLLQPQQ